MKKIILLLSILSIVQFGNAQNISGIINSYAQVTAINVNVITLSSTSGFTIGDKVLIIKMKGATINQTNTPAYGDSISMKDAGLYLFSHITAINGNNVTLDTFCNIFDTVQHIQMVTVPIYPNPTINATLTCQAWNGTTGGVLAMETPGTLSFNADIDVSEKGFRGGALKGTNFNCGSVDYFSAFPGFNGQKGEGIAEYVLAQEGGAGKLINGGGGSLCG